MKKDVVDVIIKFILWHTYNVINYFYVLTREIFEHISICDRATYIFGVLQL